MKALSLLMLFLVAIATGTAEAHTGHGVAGGFHAGFAHPFGGLDHMAAMLAVGLIASLPDGPGWRAPLAFVAAMLGGFLFQAFVNVALPVELIVAGSVLALGVMLLLGRLMPMTVAFLAIAVFGLAHGYAHGTESGDAALTAYSAGFLGATALLHAGGYGLAIASGLPGNRGLRYGAGAVMAAVGLALTMAQVA